MKATGIIVEYNPFHNGHKYHLEKAKKKNRKNIIIAVMSGNFLQRGEPAVLNKWVRTEMALLNGVDIVVELPVFYSIKSAEGFAEGAVRILDALNVETIIFGSEAGEINELKEIANLHFNENFQNLIKNRLKTGVSYPNAFNEALNEYGILKELKPNNILGVEYIKAGEKIKSKINFQTIKREKVDFYGEEIREKITSATNIRKLIINNEIEKIKETVPGNCYNLIKKNLDKIVTLDDFYPYIRYEIINNYKKLKKLKDIEQGLENRIYNVALQSENIIEFLENIKTKRYTTSRIKRILISILIGMYEDEYQLDYIKILGFTGNGRKYLNYIKNNCKLDFITNIKNLKENFTKERRERMSFEFKTDNIYKLVKSYEERKYPVIVK
ncbi:putative nucleotidyltransferase [Hypnocyclicus thermotrophus]|uniref:tRNA(Met) cytidine acetate ligase n=1 Tax=Hypnocyclicus thermotrophus TaxID=1627895 RepID=A0AA46DXU1_9FUSO|nr:nucleotidyltransferase [Hypnocyclicus thermotrophus]TDT68019.1 putative nucleotidyltransferase [Hypnocyclicus thermotrophus]